MSGKVSVVIPAHNEATVIASILGRLLETDPEGRLELVVAANGCTDDTASVARSVSRRIRVVEVSEASKIAALNAGDAAATSFPRVYLDADVTVTGETLLALADALVDPPSIGAPRLVVDVSGASIWVRWQYRVWELTDYRTSNMVGSGLYAMSEAGRARFDSFPSVISDDGYALRLFAAAERVSLGDRTFTNRAPRTLRAFIRRQARIYAGNDQLAIAYPELANESAAGSGSALLRRIARRPSLWLPALVYFAARIIARRRATRVRGDWTAQAWNRDESTRTG
ncbi:MAG: glycosyltransferase [Actinomycetota bacterium]|nr:glycosyltransferase [Actinomycetota bacterium]